MKSLFSILALSFFLGGMASSAEPVNKNCPVSGKPIIANCTTTHEGKVVGFCSGKCAKEFKADPKKFPVK